MIKKSIDKQEASKSGIKKQEYKDVKLKFSFSLFDSSDSEVCPEVFTNGYTRTLMERLRDLSGWTVKEFAHKPHKAVRNHQIAWDTTSKPDGFAHLNEQYKDSPAWQFSLTANKYGRVHGVIIDDTFYVIWLDCNHQLYPEKKT